MKTYQSIAGKLQAIFNCEKQTPPNKEWSHRHLMDIETIVSETSPSGSGIDQGTKFDFQASNPDRLVFTMPFHHMNENGRYDGWTSHKVTVTPSLANDFNLHVSGQNRDGIKDYLQDIYNEWLSSEMTIEFPSVLDKSK